MHAYFKLPNFLCGFLLGDAFFFGRSLFSVKFHFLWVDFSRPIQVRLPNGRQLPFSGKVVQMAQKKVLI